MAVHFGETGERLRPVGDDVAAVVVGDLGSAAAGAAAGGLLQLWAGAVRRLDDSTTGASHRLLACAESYESADASALRSLGLW
jgi:hypothetical protein